MVGMQLLVALGPPASTASSSAFQQSRGGGKGCPCRVFSLPQLASQTLRGPSEATSALPEGLTSFWRCCPCLPA